MCDEHVQRDISGFTSLDDVYDLLADKDTDYEHFEDTLTAYLDAMPRNRKSALEVFSQIKMYDDFNLYSALLIDFVDFLTDDEIHEVVNRYNKAFSLPISFIVGDAGIV